MSHETFDMERPVTIKGAKFRFRSLHSPDGRFGEGRSKVTESTLDRIIEITLPAVAGEKNEMIPCMEVTI